MRYIRLLVEFLRSEEHTSELQSQSNLVCRLLLEKKKKKKRADACRRNDDADCCEWANTAVRCGIRVLLYAPHSALALTIVFLSFFFFFFNDPATPEIYPLSLHDALPISPPRRSFREGSYSPTSPPRCRSSRWSTDRKSTRLNSSHSQISYAVFCF